MKREKVIRIYNLIDQYFTENGITQDKITKIKEYVDKAEAKITNKAERLSKEGWAGTLLYDACNENLLEEFGLYATLIDGKKGFKIVNDISNPNEVDKSLSNTKKLETDYYDEIKACLESDDTVVSVIGNGDTGKGESGDNKWRFPDLVKVNYNLKKFNTHTYQIALKMSSGLDFYSYEVKSTNINKRNIREYYFQALTNSAWANYGYLVLVTTIEDFEIISSELERLNNAHGIGVMIYNENNEEKLETIIQARRNPNLDFENMSILESSSKEFKAFLEKITKG